MQFSTIPGRDPPKIITFDLGTPNPDKHLAGVEAVHLVWLGYTDK